jgi:LPXTG-site transpeptidase (sortase) family protein
LAVILILSGQRRFVNKKTLLYSFISQKMILMRALLLLCMALLIFFISPIQDAHAANQEVTNLNDSGAGSLRQAIVDVGAGETITFQAGLNGTITLTSGEIDITKSMTISGTGAGQITISGNNSSRVFDITNTASVISVSGLTIANGSAGAGAGIRDRSTGTTTLSNLTFSSNTATGEGGGLYTSAGGKTTLTNVTFSNNTATNEGGALSVRTNEIEISECTFTNNTATNGFGGAIYSIADGGASVISIDKSTFSGNQAGSDGGAVANDVDTTITNSTFSGNTADDNGGAVAFRPFDTIFSTDITNSTISGNNAKQNGGGIYFENNGTLSLNNATITGNTADSDNNTTGDGGGFYESEQPDPNNNEVTFQNTILSGNTDKGGEAPNCGGDAGGNHLDSQDYNLVQDTTGCTIGGTTTNNITGQNANLGVLADNGGETETHGLNGGSPAINAGNPAGCTDHNGVVLITDQRASTRPVGGRCDIGAYEGSLGVLGAGAPPGGNTGGAGTDSTEGAGGNEYGSGVACGGPCLVGAAGKYCTFCPGVSINVPANTVQNGSRVIVTELYGGSAGGNFQLGSNIYDIKVYGPDGQSVTNFDPPLAVCLKPSNEVLRAAGWNFNNLTMFHSHAGGDWNPLSNTYGYDGRLCGSVSQLSLFTITALEMPTTGFTPGVVTALDAQPVEKAYSAISDLRLEVPALSLELPIVGVPLTIDGWDVTWLGDAAGYLEGTAYPTWVGNTAITAHVWDADNSPGSFVNLHTLQYGDEIIIHAWKLRHIYEVRAVRLVSPDNLSALPKSDYDMLTLITCQSYDEASGEYRSRIAVRAVLVDVEAQ